MMQAAVALPPSTVRRFLEDWAEPIVEGMLISKVINSTYYYPEESFGFAKTVLSGAGAAIGAALGCLIPARFVIDKTAPEDWKTHLFKILTLQLMHVACLEATASIVASTIDPELSGAEVAAFLLAGITGHWAGTFTALNFSKIFRSNPDAALPDSALQYAASAICLGLISHEISFEAGSSLDQANWFAFYSTVTTVCHAAYSLFYPHPTQT